MMPTTYRNEQGDKMTQAQNEGLYTIDWKRLPWEDLPGILENTTIIGAELTDIPHIDGVILYIKHPDKGLLAVSINTDTVIYADECKEEDLFYCEVAKVSEASRASGQ